MGNSTASTTEGQDSAARVYRFWELTVQDIKYELHLLRSSSQSISELEMGGLERKSPKIFGATGGKTKWMNRL